MINPGSYNKRIVIYKDEKKKDKEGFSTPVRFDVLKTWARVKTTKGFTLIVNNSDFEKAYTNFTIRYPKVEIDRKMKLEYNNKIYSIEYLNNVDEANVELEMQCKEITH